MRDRYGESKRKEGYKEGYDKGYERGSSNSNNYQEGYQKGYGIGYNEGSEDTKYKIYDECKSDWFNKGFRNAVKVMSGRRIR